MSTSLRLHVSPCPCECAHVYICLYTCMCLCVLACAHDIVSWQHANPPRTPVRKMSGSASQDSPQDKRVAARSSTRDQHAISRDNSMQHSPAQSLGAAANGDSVGVMTPEGPFKTFMDSFETRTPTRTCSARSPSPSAQLVERVRARVSVGASASACMRDTARRERVCAYSVCT